MQSIFGPTAVTIQAGLRETPAAVVPGGATRIQLTVTRDNWPAAGVDVGFLLSFDGGTNYVSRNLVHIGQAIADPKRPGVITAAVLSVGWSSPQPTHAKLQTNNPAANFAATATLEVT